MLRRVPDRRRDRLGDLRVPDRRRDRLGRRRDGRGRNPVLRRAVFFFFFFFFFLVAISACAQWNGFSISA